MANNVVKVMPILASLCTFSRFRKSSINIVAKTPTVAAPKNIHILDLL